jgi:hypothetical protein
MWRMQADCALRNIRKPPRAKRGGDGARKKSRAAHA